MQRAALLCVLLLVPAGAQDPDCFATSVYAGGRTVKRNCYDGGITRPKFESNAPSHGRFESCTG